MFSEDETNLRAKCPVLQFGSPQVFVLQIRLFQWISGEPDRGVPLKHQTLCSHPPNSSVVVGEGGTLSAPTRSALGDGGAFDVHK